MMKSNIDFKESNLIDRIFSEKILKEEPPVLIDLGGSGNIHKGFQKIKKHSLLICIDGDTRDFPVEKSGNIIKVENIITESEDSKCDFYLTYSPHCSSTLEPLNSKLEQYSFSNLFEVTSKILVKSTTLSDILIKHNIKVVDWFKTDTQGTDLRLFKSLPGSIREKVIAAEFEPGIIDAYKGEDKFFDLLLYMNDKNFWVDDAEIKGSKRMNLGYLKQFLPEEKLKSFETINKDSPGWCEISFLNNFENPEMKTRRNLLLGIVFSVLKSQLGFALQLAYEGARIFGDPVFSESVNNIEILYQECILQRKKTRNLNRIMRVIRKLIP
jgi:hypothetical protein